MSSNRTFFRTIVSVVALILALTIGFSVISTSRANAAEQAAILQTRDQQIAQLTSQIENLTAMMEALSGAGEYILVLRLDQEALFGMATVHSIVIQLPVDRSFYDSCRVGDDITDSSRIRLLASSLITETRVYVEDKFVENR